MVSSDADRSVVRLLGENFTTWTGCLCSLHVFRMALDERLNTWIKPVASPATIILPSERIWPEYATSLNREMVFETDRVLDEKSFMSVELVIAKS